MKTLIALFLLLGVSAHVHALGVKIALDEASPAYTGGIFQSIENANVTRSGEQLLVTPRDPGAPVELVFTTCQGLGVQYEGNQWWVLPIGAADAHADAEIDANRALWVLPLDPTSKDQSWYLTVQGGKVSARKTASGLAVTVRAASIALSQSEARPHSDPFGHRFALRFAGGPALENALAAFYWGTMLPSVVEKTMAANFPYSSGYVLSTLNVQDYAGSYPAVDHEFQIKGRMAIGSEADLDIVKRMIELQFKLMNDDPERLYRAPTSVQPSGMREYHVRRDSLNHRENAAMFPLTANIEVIEEAWNYYQARKETAWLRSSIENLEHSAGWILANTDQYGRVWSDVYYEDQVIKDGRVTQSQAFAAHAFALLAAMENALGRHDQGARFAATSSKMATVLTAPLPMGYWNANNHRFVDWVDRNAQTHDHLPLLANELPVTFGFATAEQAAAVERLVNENAGEFERFPSFMSADIAAYNKSEMGVAGPFDLCAAGRYWYWDAAFRATRNQNGVLFDQLQRVAAEGAKNGYFMSERYDMDHVYYVDGKDAHGAQKYYEYPNVFAAVLIDKFLGLTVPADADVSVAPRLTSYGSVEFGTPEYALSYSYGENGFALKNTSGKSRRYLVDLSGLGFAAAKFQLKSRSRNGMVGPRSTLTLAAGEEAHWTPEK